MSTSPQFIATTRTNGIQFVASGAPAQVAWKAGPYGSRIHLMSASQDDTTTGTLSIYRGKVLTDNSLPYVDFPLTRTVKGLPPVLTATKTTNDHLDRTNGSFIQDGWVAGMMLGIINASDNLQNQIIAHVTTVAATTLTYTGTPLNATASAMSVNTQLVQCDLLWSVSMVSGAGNSNSVAAINLMSTTNFPSFLSAPDTFFVLGPGELLIVNCGTLPASNKSINVVVAGGDY